MKDFSQRPHRLVAVLKKLYESPEGLSSNELQNEFDTSLRSIQNDLKVIKEVYGYEISEKDHTISISSVCKSQTQKEIAMKLQNRMIVRLALDLLKNSATLSKYKNAIVEKLDLDELVLPYYIKPEYFETIDIDSPMIKQLEKYIVEDYIIDIKYKDKNFRVEPYKISNFDGIWYLYAKDLKDNNLQTWAIREIREIAVVHQKYKKSDEQIDSELESYLSAHFKYYQKFKVLIKVSGESIFLFKAKKYASDQKIISDTDDSLTIEFSATSYQDVDDMIKSHLPNIEIIEPKIFKEKFVKELENYIKKIK
jgi:predicted DNA-binding transcriptional regulator YafY